MLVLGSQITYNKNLIPKFTITNTLTNCTSNNNLTEIMPYSSYTATITPDEDYTLKNARVSVSMSGTDITSTAYNSGVINIPSVTGDLVITISAVAVEPVYLTFSSSSTFDIHAPRKVWDGTMQYSTNTTTWDTWDGINDIIAVSDGTTYHLYLRGIQNTYLTGGDFSEETWRLNGTDIRCDGNIEALLDYQSVQQGIHPSIASHAFHGLFYGNTALISSPELYMGSEIPAYTYYDMFQGCTNLETISIISEGDDTRTFGEYACGRMFYGCSKIYMSDTQEGTYVNEYRLDGAILGSHACDEMFTNTGGTFTGTPNQAVYYTSNTLVPDQSNFITFSSTDEFTITSDYLQYGARFDGIVEYSTDKVNWYEWDAWTPITSQEVLGNYVIYMRGTGNTTWGYHPDIQEIDGGMEFIIQPETSDALEVAIIGNIETLLDYQTVATGGHPPMAANAFFYLFGESKARYDEVGDYVYYNCRDLVLGATTASSTCYSYMFSYSRILYAPQIKLETTAYQCCYRMFYRSSVSYTLPKLLSLELADRSYYQMFAGSSNTQTNNKSTVRISETQTGTYVNEYRIPYSGTGTDVDGTALANMFRYSNGTFTGTPEINTTYYTPSEVV